MDSWVLLIGAIILIVVNTIFVFYIIKRVNYLSFRITMIANSQDVISQNETHLTELYLGVNTIIDKVVNDIDTINRALENFNKLNNNFTKIDEGLAENLFKLVNGINELSSATNKRFNEIEKEVYKR